jgi:ribonuclease T1
LLFFAGYTTLASLSFPGLPEVVLKGFLVRRGVLKLVLTYSMLFSALVLQGVQAKEFSESVAPATVALSNLPAQGYETYQLIHQGGPFPYEKDGVIFGNRERLLPGHKRGYYREYTVRTPGSSNRGAKRIVCGGAATAPDICYYSADHYASYRRIVP